MECIFLIVDDLPSLAFPMADKSGMLHVRVQVLYFAHICFCAAVDITKEMLALIQKGLGKDIGPETNADGVTALPEERVPETSLGGDTLKGTEDAIQVAAEEDTTAGPMETKVNQPASL